MTLSYSEFLRELNNILGSHEGRAGWKAPVRDLLKSQFSIRGEVVCSRAASPVMNEFNRLQQPLFHPVQKDSGELAAIGLGVLWLHDRDVETPHPGLGTTLPPHGPLLYIDRSGPSGTPFRLKFFIGYPDSELKEGMESLGVEFVHIEEVFTRPSGALRRMYVDRGQILKPPTGPPPMSLEDLSRETGLSVGLLGELLSEAEKRVVVLSGPPGTGKTRAARLISRFISQSSDREHFVQFHPAMTYESFVQGLRPVSEDGAIGFLLTDGTVVSAADAARAELQGDTHVVLIDEINRANLPKVFGELIYLIEYREGNELLGAGGDEGLHLQYQERGETFVLPDNLQFVATMNTADRSLRSIDAAIRRRFSIFELPPSVKILKDFYGNLNHVNEVENLFSGFESLNRKLTEAIDRHHTIGHTFFMDEHMDYLTLQSRWDRQIRPLLDEYFFDSSELLEEYSVEAFWPASEAVG